MTEKDDEAGRRWHDMGGVPGAGGIDTAEHDYALWEKRVDALYQIGAARKHYTVDGLRRALEDMGPHAFETMTYYERWMEVTTRNFIAAGVFSVEELNARMEEVSARGDTYGDASLDKGG